jgi:fibronectin-binding autotransporter adhesin
MGATTADMKTKCIWPALKTISVVLLAGLSAARAGTHTWTGGGANELWSNAANWAGGAPTAVEAAPVVLIFPGGVTTTNNIAGLTIDSLIFSGDNAVLHGSGGATLTFRGNGGTNLFCSTGLYASNAIAGTLPVTLNGSNYFRMNASFHLMGVFSVVSGPGQLTLEGDGSFYYSGTQANTATGRVRIFGPTLNLTKSSGVTAVAGPVEVGDGGALASLMVRSFNQIPDATVITVAANSELGLYADESLGNLNLTGGTVKGRGGVLTLTGNVTSQNNSRLDVPVSLGGATRTFNVTGGLLISDVVSNGGVAAGITKAGAGTLVLSGTNTFTGAVIVNSGTVEAQNNSAFGSTATGVTVQSGGTLMLNGVHIGVEALSLTGTLTAAGTNSWAGAVTLPTETSINTPANTQITLSNAVGGAGSISKSGAGTLVFSGTQPNTFAGGLGITGGTLNLNKTGVNALVGPLLIGPGAGTVRLQQSGQIADTVPVSVYAGGTLDLNNNSDTIGSLAGSGAVNLAFASLTLGGDNSSTTFSGSITGLGGAPIIKNGIGTFTLTGTNNCSGTSTVNGGRLVVDGELVSHVTVAAGATLSGVGKVGNVTATSGHLQPGATPGKFSTGNLSLNNAAGVATFDIFGSSAGTGHDQIAVNGTVTLGNPTLALVVGTGGGMSNQYVLIANDGVDAVNGTFNGLPEGATVTAGLVSYTISYVGGTGNDVVLTQTGTPPPPQITRIRKLLDGTMQIDASGLPNTSYFVEATTNLTTLQWMPINFVPSAGDGRLTCVDENAASHPKRFYRLRMP